jgi:hypothetical protein
LEKSVKTQTWLVVKDSDEILIFRAAERRPKGDFSAPAASDEACSAANESISRALSLLAEHDKRGESARTIGVRAIVAFLERGHFSLPLPVALSYRRPLTCEESR